MSAKEAKVYLEKCLSSEGAPAKYRVSRVINTLEVSPGDVIPVTKVEYLMSEGVAIVVDPRRKN